MSLNENEVKHIAALARIGLDEKDIPKYQKDLSAILEYFKKLENLDTEKVTPISHITGMENAAREDGSEDIFAESKEAILKNAPERKERYVKVRSVF